MRFSKIFHDIRKYDYFIVGKYFISGMKHQFTSQGTKRDNMSFMNFIHLIFEILHAISTKFVRRCFACLDLSSTLYNKAMWHWWWNCSWRMGEVFILISEHWSLVEKYFTLKKADWCTEISFFATYSPFSNSIHQVTCRWKQIAT